MRRTIPLLLVLDDDPGAAEELTQWLRSQAFTAVAAASCLEARAIVEAVPVDGLLGHLALPDGSLFELARALRARRNAVVIGYADVEVRPPPELDACFVRPLDLSALGRLLARHFGRRQSGQQLRVNVRRSVPPAVTTSKTAGRRR